MIGAPTASPWIVRWALEIPVGRPVLDLACGGGRHALHLAARGHPVTAVDIDLAGSAPFHSSPGIEWVRADLENAAWPFPGRRFGAVVVTHYLHRPLMPILLESLEPGGVIGMELNLALLDLEPFKNLVQALEAQGFHFTSMLALGDTPGARENLFRLNDTASSQTMGSDGEHSWTDFEDFNQSVCESDWYKPAGQLVVIERHTGRWVAMSAITRFEGSDYAYNLFTGVDENYRGRGLARAVKALALEYARDNLGVTRVRTHHLEANLPMIAVDRHLGYEVIPGYYTVRKVLPGMPGG